MKQFEIGSNYYMRSPGDYDCIWIYKVTGRTDKTITIELDNGREIQKNRIDNKTSESRHAESVYPFGKYSMCPILSADHVIEV